MPVDWCFVAFDIFIFETGNIVNYAARAAAMPLPPCSDCHLACAGLAPQLLLPLVDCSF